ncbi:MAG: hypothetical protein P8188_04255 [Gemmatimonadota bacterium]
MNDFTRDRDRLQGSHTPSESEYTVKELEARLDRRLTVLESKRSSGGGFMASGALLMAAVALALGVWMVLPRDGAQEVESLTAQEVTLVDADGVRRGHLATDADGRAVLSLSDRDGRERLRLTVLGDGSPGVTIHDPESRPRAVLGYLPDGTTNLVFTDRAGEIRTLVGVGSDGQPSMSMFNDEEDSRGPETDPETP